MLKITDILKKLKNTYISIAVIFVNTLLLICLLISSFIIFENIKYKSDIKKESQSPVFKEYGETLYKAYPHLSKKDVHLLLNETWLREFEYAPYQQFKEKPTTGKFVNVHPAGFRLSENQGPWPLESSNHNVFIFGGSTAFGYGLPDHLTSASFLQKYLAQHKKTKVYNFGTGYFFTAQTAHQFLNLLQRGHMPELAVFLCGINDFHYAENIPQLTSALHGYVNRNDVALDQLVTTWLRKSPTIKNSMRPPKLSKTKKNFEQNSQTIKNIISKFIITKKIIESIAAEFGVEVLFVWQPAVSYKYNYQAHHLFTVSDFDKNFLQKGYLIMDEVRNKTTAMGDNFLWCADIQENAKEPLYVDNVHYNDKLSQMTAQCIYKGISR